MRINILKKVEFHISSHRGLLHNSKGPLEDRYTFFLLSSLGQHSKDYRRLSLAIILPYFLLKFFNFASHFLLILNSLLGILLKLKFICWFWMGIESRYCLAQNLQFLCYY